MKKKIGLLLALCMVVTACFTACGEPELDGGMAQNISVFENQENVDKMLKEEADKGYTFDNPFYTINPYGNSPLSAIVIFDTENETAIEMTVKGKTEDTNLVYNFDAEKRHILPVIGLYNGDKTEVILKDDEGNTKSIEMETELITSNALNATLDVEATDEYIDGLNFMMYGLTNNEMIAATAFDKNVDVRWMYQGGDLTLMPLKLLDSGRFMATLPICPDPSYVGSAGIMEFDLLGKIYNEYEIPGGQHHDFYVMDDNTAWVAVGQSDYSVVEDVVVRVDLSNGKIIDKIDVSEIFGDDANATVAGSLNATDRDWLHNNSIAYDEKNDLLLLSGRHIDAVIAFEASGDHNIKYIFGDPNGWDEEKYGKYFLEIINNDDNSFEWQYAQHSIAFNDKNQLILFDNGMYRAKTTNESAALANVDSYSRGVIYNIDVENMTVEQLWQYGKERGVKWYSSYISSIQQLEEGHFVLDSGGIIFNGRNYGSLAELGGPEDEFCDDDVIAIMSEVVRDDKNGDRVVWEMHIDAAETYRCYRYDITKLGNTFDVNAKGKMYGDIGDLGNTTEEVDVDNIKDYDAYVKTLNADDEIDTNVSAQQNENIAMVRVPYTAKNVNSDEGAKVILLKYGEKEGIAAKVPTRKFADKPDETILKNLSAFNGQDLNGYYKILIKTQDGTYFTGLNVKF